MSAAFIGLDLAKSVFQVHGVDAQSKVVVTKRLRRDAVLAFFVNLPPYVVGIEAGGGSHFWARELTGLGHTVRGALSAALGVRHPSGQPLLRDSRSDRLMPGAGI